MKNNKYCVINNTYSDQSTTIYRENGSSFDVNLSANKVRWYKSQFAP